MMDPPPFPAWASLKWSESLSTQNRPRICCLFPPPHHCLCFGRSDDTFLFGGLSVRSHNTASEVVLGEKKFLRSQLKFTRYSVTVHEGSSRSRWHKRARAPADAGLLRSGRAPTRAGGPWAGGKGGGPGSPGACGQSARSWFTQRENEIGGLVKRPSPLCIFRSGKYQS